jgi:hypothetical protein
MSEITLPQNPGNAEIAHGPADPGKAKELWLDIVKPMARRGKLEKVPTRFAKNAYEREEARITNYELSRRSFGGFGPNYDLIDWSK